MVCGCFVVSMCSYALIVVYVGVQWMSLLVLSNILDVLLRKCVYCSGYLFSSVYTPHCLLNARISLQLLQYLSTSRPGNYITMALILPKLCINQYDKRLCLVHFTTTDWPSRDCRAGLFDRARLTDIYRYRL